MKRLIFVFVLILLNFLMFNYLANHFMLSFTFDKMAMTLLLSFLAISIMCLIVSSFKYILKFYIEKAEVTFSSIYVDLYLDTSITIYSLLILVTLLAFI